MEIRILIIKIVKVILFNQFCNYFFLTLARFRPINIQASNLNKTALQIRMRQNWIQNL